MTENVLAVYYPKWRANCLESARWLRSGEEYEEWHRKRGLLHLMSTPEEREIEALDYEKRAARYADPDYKGA